MKAETSLGRGATGDGLLRSNLQVVHYAWADLRLEKGAGSLACMQLQGCHREPLSAGPSPSLSDHPWASRQNITSGYLRSRR